MNTLANLSPFMDTDDGVGGGQPSNMNGDAGDSAVEITDDTLVRVPGQDQPVKYKDLYKRQQADYTRKTQDHARTVKEWETNRQRTEQELNRQKRELQTMVAQLVRQQQGGGQNDPYAAIASKPYLDGQTASQLLRAIQEEGFGAVAKALKGSNSQVKTLAQQVMAMSKELAALRGERATSGFDQRVDGVLRDLGLPPEAKDFAREVYLAYEPGEELDREFPDLLKARWEQVTGLIDQGRKRKAEEARKLFLPGKGGQGTAPNSLGLKGNENAKQVTDTLWERLQAADSQAT